MNDFFADRQIQAALIGAAATIIVAAPTLIPFFVKYFRIKKLVELLRGELAKAKDVKTDVQVVRQNFTITFDKDGNHSIVRRDLIRHIAGNPPVKSKKIGWITDSFDGYLDKNGKRETEIDFNKEFGIKVFDMGAQTYLVPTTIREPGAQYDTLTTTFLFNNPLDETNTDLEYEVRYKLDTSFSFRTFWEKRDDSWVTICSAPMAELNVQMILPADLPPDKWRTGNFGYALSPLGWANFTQEVSQGKRRLTIVAQNLAAGEYRARIDAQV